MKIRGVVAAAAAVVLALGLTPSSAFALDGDDLVCVKENTRQYSEGFHTTVIHYCERWEWRHTTVTPTDPKGDHDPDGGKGGGSLPRDFELSCDQLKGLLAKADRELDIYTKRFEEAKAAYDYWLAQHAAQVPVTEAARRAYFDAQAASQTFLDLYRWSNGIDEEFEVSPKNGVVIRKKARDYTVDKTLAFGLELSAAIAWEERKRTEFHAATSVQNHIEAGLRETKEPFEEASAELAAVLQEIEFLQAALNERCG